jgi:hypothetical protein
VPGREIWCALVLTLLTLLALLPLTPHLVLSRVWTHFLLTLLTHLLRALLAVMRGPHIRTT